MEKHASANFMNGVVASVLFFSPHVTYSSGVDGRAAYVTLRHGRLPPEEKLKLRALSLELALTEMARDARMLLPDLETNCITFYMLL